MCKLVQLVPFFWKLGFGCKQKMTYSLKGGQVEQRRKSVQLVPLVPLVPMVPMVPLVPLVPIAPTCTKALIPKGAFLPIGIWALVANQR